ncbi:MAG: biotin--[acetyl-CoA-carboxylase] ligase [Thermoprotei archaeon]
MITRSLLLKLLVLDYLKSVHEATIREISWKTGVSDDVVSSTVYELTDNYLMDVSSTKVSWSVVDNPSTLRPWGWKIEHLVLLGSTMDYARGCGLWTIVVAEYQFYGRGRHGKEWIGPLGGLWVTLRFPMESSKASLVPVAAPLVLIDTLKQVVDIDAEIKWPNDIVFEDKKLAGILVEGETYQDRIVVNVGIGLNVNNNPPLPGTTSLKYIRGRLTPRNTILSLLIGRFSRIDKLLEDPEELFDRYMAKLSTLGKRVRAETSSGIVEGVAVDVNEYGYLEVETSTGKKLLDPNTTYELKHLD